MWIFTEHEKRRYKDYAIVIVVGILLYYLRGMDIFTAMGCMFSILVIAELGSVLLSRIVVHLLFERVYPKSIKELKHTDKQYQYILDLGKQSIYSYVYTQPLEQMDVRCWKMNGRYVIEVCKKRRTRSV